MKTFFESPDRDRKTSGCILCNSFNWKALSLKDLFQIFKCKDCGLIFAYPIPDEDKVLESYSKGKSLESSIVEKQRENGERNFPEWKIKESMFFYRGITEYKRTGNILDIGCLWGLFLSIAKKKGWDCYGVEPFTEAADYAREKFGLNIFQGDIKKAHYPNNYFDVITMFDVIEHSVNPANILAETHRILKNDGLLCVGTPNLNGIYTTSQNIYGKLRFNKLTPNYLNPPFHFYGFNKKNIKKLLNKAGFEVIEIKTFSSFIMNNLIPPSKNIFSFKLLLRKCISILEDYTNSGDRMICYATKKHSSTNS